jgi:hypothetical protein
LERDWLIAVAVVLHKAKNVLRIVQAKAIIVPAFLQGEQDFELDLP